MNEIDLVQSFRAGVAAPSGAVRSAARARLVAAFPGEEPTLARSRPRRPPRRLRAAVAAGLIAALAALALAIGTLDTGGPSVLERAQAAVEPNGRILHVVVRIVDDGVTSRGESWVPADGSTGRSIEVVGGSTAECISSETQLRCFDPARNVIDVYRYNPEAVGKGSRLGDLPQFRLDRPESLSRALGAGYARLVGDATIEGTPVFAVLLAVPWVEEDGTVTPVFDSTSPTLYVDRETYFPVAERFPDASSTTYYETFEFLPDDAEHRKLLALSAPATAKIVVHPVGEGPQG
jgi:hypothetical protein